MGNTKAGGQRGKREVMECLLGNSSKSSLPQGLLGSNSKANPLPLSHTRWSALSFQRPGSIPRPRATSFPPTGSRQAKQAAWASAAFIQLMTSLPLVLKGLKPNVCLQVQLFLLTGWVALATSCYPRPQFPHQ